MRAYWFGGIIGAARNNDYPDPSGSRAHRWRCSYALVRFCAAVALALWFAGDSRIVCGDENPKQETERLSADSFDLDRFVWDFGRETDENFDDWPDGWQRKRGGRYPGYVKVAIVAKNPESEQQLVQLDTQMLRVWPSLRRLFKLLPPLPPSIADRMVDRYIRIDLDGGLVLVQSTQVPASQMFQYRFSCDVMTAGIRHDAARAELVFLNSRGDHIAAHSTEAVRGSNKWMSLKIDRIQPPANAESMIVRLLVDGAEDGLEDIRGTIGFDNIRIEQFPLMHVTTDVVHGVYSYGRPVTVSAKIRGLPVADSKVRFRLLDHNGREISSQLVSVPDGPQERLMFGPLTRSQLLGLDAEVVASQERAIPQPGSPDSSTQPDDPPRTSGSNRNETSGQSITRWTLPRLEPGFYRIAASLAGSNRDTLASETTVAVVDSLVSGPPHGTFGWTLPGGHNGLSPSQLADWLTICGVAWVKYPCWSSPNDFETAERTASTINKLQERGIQTIGMLDRPPDRDIEKYDVRGRRDLVAAHLFSDVALWRPLLEPVMTRLTLKVRTWQIGADRDHSFLGRPRLKESIAAISTGLRGFGQPIDVALSWPWAEPDLPANETSWQAVNRSSDPPLNARELDSFLRLKHARSQGDGPRTWLLLDPINQREYRRDDRIRDMTLRMAATRNHRVQAAFVTHPRDTDQGLLTSDGRPSEMLLPWRTTSRLIGNLRQAGSLQLRSGANNIVFVGADRAVLMLWAPQPTEELIYLGDDAQLVDVWGRKTPLRTEMQHESLVQRVGIGSLPTFVIGADPMLLALRMSVELEPPQIDSLLGRRQKLTVHFTNPTRDSMYGDVEVLPPSAWNVEEPRHTWELQAGRSHSRSFGLVLGNEAKVGQYDLPIRLRVQTNKPQQITVHRSIAVGPTGLTLKVTTRLLRDGDLRVSLEMQNQSARPLTYDCMLFPPPGRQYQRRLVSISPDETIRRDFFLARGQELIGKEMLLRADEQDGQRVLNYVIDVTK